MAISAVGSIAVSTGSATSSVSPTAVGDILVLTANATTSTGGLVSVSGGGVTTWTKLQQATPSTSLDIWYGVVTATGAATITTTNGTSTFTAQTLAALQFTGGSAGSWSVDGSGANTSITAATSGNYASLTPAGANELYVAMLGISLTSRTIGGSTAGFTYANPVGASGNETSMAFVYNPTASSPTAQSPAFTVSGLGGTGGTVAALLVFTPSGALTRRNVGLSAAVRRAAVYCREQSGLYLPERGLIVPRLA